MIKISNLTSSRGNKVANQFRIIDSDNDCEYFQSYDSIIAMKMHNSNGEAILLDETYWNYSRTTSKYRSMFLGESTKETEAKIKSGEYKLTNLNA